MLPFAALRFAHIRPAPPRTKCERALRKAAVTRNGKTIQRANRNRFHGQTGRRRITANGAVNRKRPALETVPNWETETLGTG